MLTVFIRAIVLYAITLITLRGMGKHQLGQFQPYEFALAILISDLMATPMGDISTPLLHGVLPVAALFVVHCVLTLLCMKSDRARAIISGKPSVVVANGIIDQKELNRLCLSLSDLLEGLRESGILDPARVGTAIVEADGKISAFPGSQERSVSPRDLGLATPHEGMPLTLVLGGHIQKNNLMQSGRDVPWLLARLAPYNLTPEQVLLVSLDTAGRMHVQTNQGATLQFAAMEEEAVSW